MRAKKKVFLALILLGLALIGMVQWQCHWKWITSSDQKESASSPKEQKEWALALVPTSQSTPRGSQDRLSDPDLLEPAYLALEASLSSPTHSTTRLAASRFLTQALAWRENPSRKLILIEVESLIWGFLKASGSRPAALQAASKDPAHRALFIAFRDHAPEEFSLLEQENPNSMLVQFLKQI